jgi:hypothetical protein
MRFGNVQQVHRVSDACSITRRIIIAVHLKPFPLSMRDLKENRNDVSFLAMILAALECGARRIEVPQAHLLEGRPCRDVLEYAFDG